MQRVHARHFYLGSEVERLALDLSLYPEGIFFLQDDGFLCYAAGGAWEILGTANTPLEGLTLHSQGAYADYDFGSHTPPVGHWFVVALDEGLYLLDDTGGYNGPMVAGGENLVPSGDPKNIFVNVVDGVARFRPLIAGSNVTILQYTDHIEISAALMDTPISGENIGEDGGATIYVNTISASLKFNGIKGAEGLAASNNTGTHEIELFLDVPALGGLSSTLDPLDDLVPVYKSDGAEHQKATLAELFDPHYYFGYQNQIAGASIDIDLDDADTWYPVMRTATVWEEGFVAGEYDTGSGCVIPPDRPFVQKVTLNLYCVLAAETTIAILIGGAPAAEVGLTSYFSTGGARTVSMSGILVTQDANDIISVGAKNANALETLYVWHMDLTVERIRGAEAFI